MNKLNAIQTSLNLNGLKFSSQQAKLTKQEKELYDLLPVGKENAVQGAYLAKILNINKRTVIDKVNKIRLKSIGIGSTTIDGYFKFKNYQEYIEFMRRIRAENFRRSQVIKAMENIPVESFIQSESSKEKQEVNQ